MKKNLSTTKNKKVSLKRLEKSSKIGEFFKNNEYLIPLIYLLTALIELINTFV